MRQAGTKKARSSQRQVAIVSRDLTATSLVEQDFARLYERACPEAVAHARTFLSHDEAWDVVQRTALELFERWDQMPLEHKTVAYFLRAVHRDILDDKRVEERYEGSHLSLE
ncbi:MAG: hypothetical protein H0X64_10845, partial [Gemmatimonadaceae bacterium]|nr:hypothetical protein [Gemmatimonadaceae bacterium]